MASDDFEASQKMKHSSRHSRSIVCFRRSFSMTSSNSAVFLFVWIAILSWLSGSASASQYDFIHCDDKCDESLCPELTYCEGVPLKDSCNCCMVCSDDKYQPHARTLSVPSSGGQACKQVRCPKFKICSENMQGLPLCKCPSTFFCRKKKKREICATNGETYPSRCHMRIASCNLGLAVRKKYRGPCSPEKDRKMRRRRMRKERRRSRGEVGGETGGKPSVGGGSRNGSKNKAGRKNGKEKTKRRRGKNRNRRKIGNRRSRGKRRIRKYRRNRRHDEEASKAFEEAFAHYTWSK